MLKSFKTTILTIGAFLLASSLAVAAQQTPPPDPGKPAPQHHAKTRKSKKPAAKKPAAKKPARKKTAKKTPA